MREGDLNNNLLCLANQVTLANFRIRLFLQIHFLLEDQEHSSFSEIAEAEPLLAPGQKKREYATISVQIIIVL